MEARILERTDLLFTRSYYTPERMVRCFHIVVLVCSIATFATLAVSTGSTNWKEDLDIYKNMHKYIGLWRACIVVKGDSVSELPPFRECDRDFLRPRLQEPPGK